MSYKKPEGKVVRLVLSQDVWDQVKSIAQLKRWSITDYCTVCVEESARKAFFIGQDNVGGMEVKLFASTPALESNRAAFRAADPLYIPPNKTTAPAAPQHTPSLMEETLRNAFTKPEPPPPPRGQEPQNVPLEYVWVEFVGEEPAQLLKHRAPGETPFLKDDVNGDLWEVYPVAKTVYPYSVPRRDAAPPLTIGDDVGLKFE